MIENTRLPLKILLADDDKDDRFFFDTVLKGLSIPTTLATVEDGAMLMDYLHKNTHDLPNALFLDLNMPKMNGAECLTEIKKSESLKHIPVIIYSTSYHEDVADVLYNHGAHYYIRKTDLTEIEKILKKVLTLLMKKIFDRPLKKDFVLNLKV